MTVTRSNKLLILDLDETLIYSTKEILSRAYDFQLDQYFVYKRPGLEDFLSECSCIFRVSVWTASSTNYAYQIIEKIFPKNIKLEFVFTQERCVFNFNHETGVRQIIKPLKKIQRKKYLLSDVIIVDDLRETFQKNYGNAILVSKYSGEEEDEELYLLLKFLKSLRDVDDVRKIDKRGWKDKIKIE
jgi:carboxy-terminal domain RNA polymerase II polypeptide A small phosphatase